MGWIQRWRSKRAELARFRTQSRREVFDYIYHSHKWGGDSRSGKGSGLERTFRVRAALPGLLDELAITSIVDIPCGDHGWMGTLDLGGRPYTGCDIVETLIERNRQTYPDRRFQVLDLCEGPAPDADLVLCRDLLVHLSFADIGKAVGNLLAGQGRYLLCTTFPDVTRNVDTVTGKHRRLNLCLPPFNWPAPCRLLAEGSETLPVAGKYLGLWELSTLRRDLALPGWTATVSDRGASNQARGQQEIGMGPQ